jgi:crotonobetainyl-CoA:carnitine CoA-transferase CaiB-like acyl-CoA transferase
VVGRVGAAAVLAQIIRRRRTGQGGTVSMAQAEIILTAMADLLLGESLSPGSLTAGATTDASQSLYPCAGDDEWCAVEARDDTDWRALCAAIGRADLGTDPRLATAEGRLAHRTEIDRALAEDRRARAAPGHGTAPGRGRPRRGHAADRRPPRRSAPGRRGFFSLLRQPGIDMDLPTESRPARSLRLADPPLRPAPFPGEHSRDVCRDWLGMDDTEINAQEASGALEVAWGLPVEPRSAARDQRVLSQAHAQVARLGDD